MVVVSFLYLQMTDKTKGDHIDEKCNEYYNKKTAIICGIHSLQEVLPLSSRIRNFMILDQNEHDLEQVFIYNCKTP